MRSKNILSGVALFVFGSSLAVLLFLEAHLWAQGELPPCNGMRGNPETELCGFGRPCDDIVQCTNGSTVIEKSWPKSCLDGTVSERCVDSSVTCTQTFYCKAPQAPATGCVPNLDAPYLDAQGHPVVSTASKPNVQSCENI